MRVMPYPVARPGSVMWGRPVLHMADLEFDEDDDVREWTYQDDVIVAGSVGVVPGAFLESTMLDPEDGLRGVLAVLLVECDSTGYRRVGTVQMAEDGSSTPVEVHVEAGRLADQVRVTQMVVLDRPDSTVRANRAAHLRGSRLAEEGGAHTFNLEGDGSNFPTESFVFEGGSYPSGSAWVLHFDAEDLDAPYVRATRLYLNEGHPMFSTLRSRTNLLEREIFLQMLATVALRFEGDVIGDFEDGSVGQVLDELCEDWLAAPLGQAVQRFREDPGAVMALSQVDSGFLEVK